MNDCIFCKIIRGEIPAKRVYEDEEFISFPDIHPDAKTHLLVIPRQHVASLKDAEEPLLGRLLATANRVARAQGLGESGYRVVVNTGPDAGQTVFHLHLHLLGGEPLGAGFGRGRG